LAEGVQAVGIQAAHSGTVLGLIFDPKDPELEARMGEAERKVRELGIREIWRFHSRGL
jgi:uncharacterized protein involved in propanediol utilization